MITELVCPQFYVDEWKKLGEPRSKDEPGEFEVAADDGVCRVMKSTKDEFGGPMLVCRCGIVFAPADAQHVELGK